MLEACLTQGAGLHALAVQPAPRAVAMASHGDRQSELPLLCSLCTTWTDLGYSVIVLDATMAESTSGPGLQQLVDDPACHTGACSQNHASWPIIPAALGLEQLCLGTPRAGGSRSRLQLLGRLFRNYEIVLVYASSQNLTAYLPGSGIAPLLAVSAKGMSLLSAYQSLKQLLIIGRLQPTIVAVMDESDQNSLASGPSMCKSLQDCAMAFLAHQVTPLPVHIPAKDGQPFGDMHRLALRLLESAFSLFPATPALTAPGHQRSSGEDHLARSH
jgi:hypothetical protein